MEGTLMNEVIRLLEQQVTDISAKRFQFLLVGKAPDRQAELLVVLCVRFLEHGINA